MTQPNYQNDARLILSYSWGRVYEWLLEEEGVIPVTSGDAKCTWYIDDRADPNTFKNLLSWANPDIAQKRFNKHQSNSGLTYLTSREGRELLSHLKSNPAFCSKVLLGI